MEGGESVKNGTKHGNSKFAPRREQLLEATPSYLCMYACVHVLGELLKAWGTICCAGFRNATGTAELGDDKSKKCPISVFHRGRDKPPESPFLN